MKFNWRAISYFAVGAFVLLIGLVFINKDILFDKNKNVIETEILYNQNTKKPEVKTEEKTDQTEDENETTTEEVVENQQEETKKEEKKEEKIEVKEPVREEVYDGLTMEELIDKLNRSMNSTISGYGEIYARRSLELGIDPYLALAITLHETGCKWDCSTLVKQCNNVGGMKGQPGCGGGSYKAFDSLEEGIVSYLNNLYNNYYAYGLTTPETIGPKYAASGEWASKINYYIGVIRAN